METDDNKLFIVDIGSSGQDPLPVCKQSAYNILREALDFDEMLEEIKYAWHNREAWLNR